MRGYLPDFHVETPSDLDDALARISAQPGAWSPLAGGTDIMVVLAAGQLKAGKYLNIWGLDALRGIRVADDFVTLGALTTYSELREHPLVGHDYPMLVEAARQSGAAAIQNRGTLGGNIANASPAADSPPALLAYEAQLELVSKTGTRVVPYRGFHTGYKQTIMRPDELVRAVKLPRDRVGQAAQHFYRKVGTRRAQAITKVGIAALVCIEAEVITYARLAFSSVGPTVMLAEATQAAIVGRKADDAMIEQARAVLARELTPIDDVRSSADYRAMVAGNLLESVLRGDAFTSPGR